MKKTRTNILEQKTEELKIRKIKVDYERDIRLIEEEKKKKREENLK